MAENKVVAVKCEIQNPKKRICNCLAKLEVIDPNNIRIHTAKKSFNVFMDQGYNPAVEKIIVPRENLRITISSD